MNIQLNSKKSMSSISVSLVLIMTVLFSPFVSHAQEIDLLLKGGHVIDAKNKINGKMDVAVKDGKVFRVAADIPASSAKKNCQR